MRLRPVAALPAILLALGACGTDSGASGTPREPMPSTTASAPAPASPPTPATTATELPTDGLETTVPSRPSDVYDEVTVVGTIVRADAECTVLEDENGIAWRLLGAEPPPALADRVKVVGVSRPGDEGACDGAVPLAVTSLALTQG